MATYKTHVALRISDLERSVTFYQNLLGIAPIKHKPGYAKFDSDNPPLNLTLNLSNDIAPHGALSHLGIQVESTEVVGEAIARLKAAGLSTIEEFNSNCCYALQDKAWVSDPDGNRWEIFVVHVEDIDPELRVKEVVQTTDKKQACCS